MPRIAIYTVENDIHALVVCKAFERHGDTACHVIYCDKVSEHGGLSWFEDGAIQRTSSINDHLGRPVEVATLDLVWWRRVNAPQKAPEGVSDPIELDVIDRDCRAAMLGCFLTDFRGTWINDVDATRNAQNKLLQLRAAKKAGLRVPRTLVSQDPYAARSFCESLSNEVVVKPVRGPDRYPLVTKRLIPEHLESEECIRLCPTIFQELVPGQRHIRAHCFGERVIGVEIESPDLDWRINLDVPFRFAPLTDDLTRKLVRLHELLNLKMGIVDMKFGEDDEEPFFLEVNPQGQFLFCEGLGGVDLTTAFVDFLHEQAQRTPEA